MSWATISEALGDILADDANLSALVTGIFSLQAPQGQTLPYVVMLPVAGAQDDDFAHDGIEYSLQISVFADRAAGVVEADTIARRIRDLLHRRTVTLPGFADAPVLFDSDQTFADDNTIHALMQLSIAVVEGV